MKGKISDGALTIDQIEEVRKADMGITKCDGGFMIGDIDLDWDVDFSLRRGCERAYR